MRHCTRIVEIKDLEDARDVLGRIGCHDEGINIMAPKCIYRCINVRNVDTRAANIIKQEMLAKGGEAAIGMNALCLDRGITDLILMGREKDIIITAEKLRRQFFGTQEIAEEIEKVLMSRDAELKFKFGGKIWDMKKKFYVMGVLNITPDSFSDGGKFLDPDIAAEHAIFMEEMGADIIDIGGESTRPGSDRVSIEEELRRVLPVLKRLQGRINIPISIDTYKPEVAQKCMKYDVSIINDITGLSNDKMIEISKDNDCGVIIMHMKGTPKNMQRNPHYDDVIGEIYKFFCERIEKAVNRGLTLENIMIDPGIGFGKTLNHNLSILKNLREFCSLGRPVMVGTSRKSFIGLTLDLPVNERLEGTLATSVIALMNGARMVRAHDVKEMRRSADIAFAIMSAKRFMD